MDHPNYVEASDATKTDCSSSNLIAPTFQTSKLRSLLPKNLLRQPSKPGIQVSPMQVVSDPEVRSSLCTNTNPASTFQVGQIIMAQSGDEVRSVHDGTVESTSETVDNMLQVHFRGPSASQVIALSEAQIQKLLAMSTTGDVNSKQPVLHMVTIEEGDEGHPMSMTIDHLPVTLEDHPVSIVEEPSMIESNPHSETPSSSPLSSTMTDPTTLSSQSLSRNTAPATPNMQSATLIKSHPTSDPQVLHDDMIPSTNVASEDKGKGEIVKKTMIEAFVKMVVCRKVTIQTIKQSTGQVLDTQVNLEEEEPVILGVDCVETTEDHVSHPSNVSQEDKDVTVKSGPSLDGGLKFLSTISESQQKLSKSLLSDVLLKSSLKRAVKEKLIPESTGVCKSKQPSKSEEKKFDVKEAHSFSDFEYNEEDCNDESEDYVPGKDDQSKRLSKQKTKLSSRQPVMVRSSSNKEIDKETDTKPKPYKKRGRKRRWDNALGLALNLKTCQFCNKRFKTSQGCVKHMKKGKCVSSVYCFLCAKPFESEEELEIHLTSHEEKSKSSSHKCNDCKRTYRTRAGYLKHFKMGTCLKRDEFEDGEAGDFACNICSVRFSTEAYLKLHKYKVHENPSDTHTCPDCGKKFYSAQGYNKHRSGRSCTEPLKCKICGKTYSSKAKESFKIHMRHHRTEATGVLFECDECDRTYMTQMALNKHKLSHTGVKPYKCEICGKGFAMRYMVKDHARTHTGERPYPCNLCGSTFSNRGHLARHMRSHENGTLFKRGRPKKVRGPEEPSPGLKIIDVCSVLQNLERQTIQVVDSQMLDNQMPGTPMVIRTDNNTIIITEGWPAAGVSGAGEVTGEQQSDQAVEVIAPVSQDPVPSNTLPSNS